jgi:hypothetical protein
MPRARSLPTFLWPRLFNDRFKRALPTGTYAVIWSWGRFNFTGS